MMVVRATTGYVVTGLVNGTRYYFRVFAHNAAGNGPSSNVVNQIPRTVPQRTPPAGVPRQCPGRADVDAAGLDGWGGDHPLRHPTLHQPDHRLGVPHDHGRTDRTVVQRHWSHQRRALLLPDHRHQRRRDRHVQRLCQRRTDRHRRDRVLLPELHRRTTSRSRPAPAHPRPGYRSALDRDHDGIACE